MQQQASVGRERALAAYQRGDADALDRLDAALAAAPLDGGLLIARATLAQELRLPDAQAGLRAMLAQAPDWLDGQVALARLRWGAGEQDDFLDALEAALDRLPQHAGLWMRYMMLLAESGASLRAADVAAGLRRSGGDAPALRLIEGGHAGSAGAHARAQALLDSLPADMPGRDAALARQRLRAGDADAAVTLLDRARALDPRDGGLWALTELAWRAAGDPRHGWLLPPGFHATIQIDTGMLTELADTLHRLHDMRWPPLGQSVRDGTQTRGDLQQRREPVLAALFRPLQDAVDRHVATLPAADPRHPLLAHRGVKMHITSSWSIRMRGGGHHVSHVHPGGALSSAFYVEVPDASDPDPQQGWLELGRPPADIPLALPPVATIAPRPGRLVLFPGFLYHGTRPFTAGRRMSVAFDVSPVT